MLDRYKRKRSYVGIVRPVGRRVICERDADGDWNDNLLALNNCSNIGEDRTWLNSWFASNLGDLRVNQKMR